MNDDDLREDIARRLKNGLDTESHPRAETGEDVQRIINRLRTEAGSDLDARLRIGGVTDYTVTVEDMEQPCETCMYYLVHRRYCELPELDIPVEAHWSCRLWRI